MATVLLLGADPDEGRRVGQAIGESGEVAVRSVDRAGFEAILEQDPETVDLIVVGRRFEGRVEAVQLAARRAPDLASILLCDPAETRACRDSLLVAPGIGRHVRCLPADHAGLGDTVRKAIEGTARRRQLRRTLEVMTTRLDRSGAPSPFVSSQGFVNRLMDELPVGVLILDSRGRVAESNRAAESLLARTGERLIGRRVADLFPRSGELDPGPSSGFLPEDGRTGPVDVEVHGGRILSVRSVPFETSAAGDATIVILEDITERRQAEETLSRRAKLEAVGQLAGGVAHHFNNLLTVIQGYAEEIVAGGGGEAAAEIQQAAKRAAELTRQLLAFGERQMVRPELLRLSDLILDVLPLLERSLGDDIRVETRLSTAEDLVRADRGQLEQVLISLAFNARDAMPEGGRLTLEVETGQEAPATGSTRVVRMIVRDTGSGMEDEILSRLFEPFFTTKPVGQGTGLGLAAARGIVRRHGGQIHIQSRPSRGTTVIVELPSARVDEG